MVCKFDWDQKVDGQVKFSKVENDSLVVHILELQLV